MLTGLSMLTAEQSRPVGALLYSSGHHWAMSILRRTVRPARAALQGANSHYFRWLEDLIHAVKNETVGRLDQVDGRVDKLQSSLESSHSAAFDQVSMHGVALRKLETTIDATRQELADTRQDLTERIANAAPSVQLRQLVGAPLPEIDESASAFLNYTQSHVGPLADAGLWVNHPFNVEWSRGSARLGSVNERIMEQPFVFGAVADLNPGARILDLGGGESTVGFALASLGHHVTVIEPQGYPFRHPNLTVFEKPLEQFDAVEPFDAAIALSSIEHFGIGHYKGGPEPDANADVEAVEKMAELLAADGRLILTTPFGPSEVNDVERIYDRTSLLALLAGWTITKTVIGRRLDGTTWGVEATELGEPAGPGRVAMVVALPPSR